MSNYPEWLEEWIDLAELWPEDFEERKNKKGGKNFETIWAPKLVLPEIVRLVEWIVETFEIDSEADSELDARFNRIITLMQIHDEACQESGGAKSHYSKCINLVDDSIWERLYTQYPNDAKNFAIKMATELQEAYHRKHNERLNKEKMRQTIRKTPRFLKLYPK